MLLVLIYIYCMMYYCIRSSSILRLVIATIPMKQEWEMRMFILFFLLYDGNNKSISRLRVKVRRGKKKIRKFIGRRTDRAVALKKCIVGS